MNTEQSQFADIANQLLAHPEQFAHYLAHMNPTLATELLEELLYWRIEGVI